MKVNDIFQNQEFCDNISWLAVFLINNISRSANRWYDGYNQLLEAETHLNQIQFYMQLKKHWLIERSIWKAIKEGFLINAHTAQFKPSEYFKMWAFCKRHSRIMIAWWICEIIKFQWLMVLKSVCFIFNPVTYNKELQKKSWLNVCQSSLIFFFFHITLNVSWISVKLNYVICI